MPFGSLSVGDNAIPSFEPPYTNKINKFTDVNLLQVRYRTSYANVRHLVPEFLELEDEPLVTASVVEYGLSTLGQYNEYVHQVEVKHDGETFDYCLSLILDNESAIFIGREKFGLPKTFGKVTLERRTGSGTLVAAVEKPAGQTVVQFSFTLQTQLTETPPSGEGKRVLNLRVIPSPIEGAPPSLRELIPHRMVISGGSV